MAKWGCCRQRRELSEVFVRNIAWAVMLAEAMCRVSSLHREERHAYDWIIM
jgi:hypothetical protein